MCPDLQVLLTFLLSIATCYDSLPYRYLSKRGWVRLHNSCYLFSRYASTWPASLGTCMTFETSLASIEDSEENNAVKQYLSTLYHNPADMKNSSYWIGGNAIEVKGHFIWIRSLSEVTYTDWGQGHPGSADCIQMKGGDNFTWHDDLCETKYNFICEDPFSYSTIPPVIG